MEPRVILIMLMARWFDMAVVLEDQLQSIATLLFCWDRAAYGGLEPMGHRMYCLMDPLDDYGLYSMHMWTIVL